MPTLTFKKPAPDLPHAHDVQRIVDVCALRHHAIAHNDAREAWLEHSEMLAAGWFALPSSDDELFWIVQGLCATDD